jgi:pheromone a factor receptor
MRHPEIQAVALIAAFLILVPLPYQWRTRNFGMISLIAWLFVVNLIYGINAIIWADNVDIVAVPWCDISMFFTGTTVLRAYLMVV